MVPACARYEARPLDASGHVASLWSRSAEEPGVAALARSLSLAEGEAEAFDVADGLSLREAEAVALFFNPELRVARQRSGVALAAAEHAGLWEDPMLGVDGERILESVEYPWIIGSLIEVTIPISGRLEAEKRQAEGEHLAAVLRVVDAEWSTRIELRREWFEWSAAASRLDALQAFAERLSEVAGIVRSLEDAGELARLESRLFTIEEANTAIELRQMRDEVARGVLRVKREMGLSPSAPVMLVRSSLAAAECGRAEEDSSRLIASSTRLAVARAEYEAAERTLALEIRKQYPDLRVGLGGKSEEDQPRFMFGLSLPLPIWNRNQGPIAEASAARELARAEHDALLERLIASLADSRLALESAAARRDGIERTVVPLADQQQADAQRSAELGEVDTVLLLQSITLQYRTKRELIDAALAHVLAGLEVVASLGPAQPLRGEIHP